MEIGRGAEIAARDVVLIAEAAPEIAEALQGIGTSIARAEAGIAEDGVEVERVPDPRVGHVGILHQVGDVEVRGAGNGAALGEVCRLEVGVGEGHIPPDAGAVGGFRQALKRPDGVEFLKAVVRDEVEIVGGRGDSRQCCDREPGRPRRDRTAHDEILVEIMRIQIGDMIHRDVPCGHAFDDFRRDRGAERVGDEVEGKIRGARFRLEQAQPDKEGEERVPGGFAPAGRDFVGFRRPVEDHHDLHGGGIGGADHVRRGEDRLLRVEPPRGALTGQVVVQQPATLLLVDGQTDGHERIARGNESPVEIRSAEDAGGEPARGGVLPIVGLEAVGHDGDAADLAGLERFGEGSAHLFRGEAVAQTGSPVGAHGLEQNHAFRHAAQGIVRSGDQRAEVDAVGAVHQGDGVVALERKAEFDAGVDLAETQRDVGRKLAGNRGGGADLCLHKDVRSHAEGAENAEERVRSTCQDVDRRLHGNDAAEDPLPCGVQRVGHEQVGDKELEFECCRGVGRSGGEQSGFRIGCRTIPWGNRYAREPAQGGQGIEHGILIEQFPDRERLLERDLARLADGGLDFEAEELPEFAVEFEFDAARDGHPDGHRCDAGQGPWHSDHAVREADELFEFPFESHDGETEGPGEGDLSRGEIPVEQAETGERVGIPAHLEIAREIEDVDGAASTHRRETTLRFGGEREGHFERAVRDEPADERGPLREQGGGRRTDFRGHGRGEAGVIERAVGRGGAVAQRLGDLDESRDPDGARLHPLEDDAVLEVIPERLEVVLGVEGAALARRLHRRQLHRDRWPAACRGHRRRAERAGELLEAERDGLSDRIGWRHKPVEPQGVDAGRVDFDVDIKDVEGEGGAVECGRAIVVEFDLRVGRQIEIRLAEVDDEAVERRGPVDGAFAEADIEGGPEDLQFADAVVHEDLASGHIEDRIFRVRHAVGRTADSLGLRVAEQVSHFFHHHEAESGHGFLRGHARRQDVFGEDEGLVREVAVPDIHGLREPEE